MDYKQFPSAKVVLRDRKNNKILLLARAIHGEIGYEPVGGKLEADFKRKISENYEACALREIQEELGIKANITHYIGSYYFFWSIKENVCSHCVLFLGDIISGEVKTAQQEECGHLSPVWVTSEQIKAGKIPVRDYHVGLSQLLIKAANIIEINHSAQISE